MCVKLIFLIEHHMMSESLGELETNAKLYGIPEGMTERIHTLLLRGPSDPKNLLEVAAWIYPDFAMKIIEVVSVESLSAEMLEYALMKRHDNLARDLIAKGCPISDDAFGMAVIFNEDSLALQMLNRGFVPKSSELYHAIDRSHSEVVNWIMRVIEKNPGRAKFPVATLNLALKKGQIETAQHMMRLGCVIDNETLELAIGTRDVLTIRMVLDIKMNFTITSREINALIRFGNIDLVQIVLPLINESVVSDETLYYLFEHDKHKMLDKLFYETNLCESSRMLEFAVECKLKDYVDVLLTNNVRVTNKAFEKAVEVEEFDLVLKWARNRVVYPSARAFENAISLDKFDVANELLDIGCEVSINALEVAIGRGYKYTPVSKRIIWRGITSARSLDLAIERNNVPVVIELLKQNCEQSDIVRGMLVHRYRGLQQIKSNAKFLCEHRIELGAPHDDERCLRCWL